MNFQMEKAPPSSSGWGCKGWSGTL